MIQGSRAAEIIRERCRSLARSLFLIDDEKEADLSVKILQLNVLSASCSSLPRDSEEADEEISNYSEPGMGVADG